MEGRKCRGSAIFSKREMNNLHHCLRWSKIQIGTATILYPCDLSFYPVLQRTRVVTQHVGVVIGDHKAIRRQDSPPVRDRQTRDDRRGVDAAFYFPGHHRLLGNTLCVEATT